MPDDRLYASLEKQLDRLATAIDSLRVEVSGVKENLARYKGGLETVKFALVVGLPAALVVGLTALAKSFGWV